MIAHSRDALRSNSGSNGERLRILVVAPQPFYTPRGTPLSVYYRTLVLAHSGCAKRIDLLAYGQGDDVDFSDADVPEEVRIIRVPRFGISHVKIGPSLTKAFLDIFMILYTIGLLLRRRYDMVHAHEESVFWCRFLKPIFRFRLIYDMHSSLPQQLTNFKFTRSKALIRTFDRLERTCLRAADAVITICPDLENYALSHGVEASQHFLIENSIFDDVRMRNGTLRGESTGPQARGSMNVEGGQLSQNESANREDSTSATQHRIVYAGTFEPYQGIDLLLKAFAAVVRKRSDVELVLVGGLPAQVEQMTDLAVHLGIAAHCRFLGQLSKSEAMQHMRSATVLVSPRIRGTNTPLKVYEILASGIPLVATRIWSHTQVLNDDVCLLVEPEPESLAEGLLFALTDERKRDSIVAAARSLYERRYSREAYEAKMDALLDCIAARAPRRLHTGMPRRATERGVA